MKWWKSPNAGDNALLSRFGHSSATVDASEDWGTALVIMYGGVSPRSEPHDQQTALSDVLVLQVSSDTWLTPQLCNEGPGQRAFHCACALGRKMYVFGGHVMSYEPQHNKRRRTFYQDLWCLDTGTWEWSQVTVEDSAVPPRRDMATLVSVGGDKLLLFGGRSESTRAIGDLWQFDTELRQWTQLKLAGAAPPARKMHTMTVMEDGSVVVFGGEKDSGVLDDLWVLRGLDGLEPPRWVALKVRPCPSARFGHAAAALGSTLLVFGGCLDQTTFLSITRNYTQCRELWTLHLPSLKWVRIEFEALEVPAERMLHTLSALPGGRLLLLGGRGTTTIFRDVWFLDVDPSFLVDPTPDAATAQAAQLSEATTPPTDPSPTPKDGTSQLSTSAPSLLQALLSPIKLTSPLDSGRGTPTNGKPDAPAQPQDIPAKAGTRRGPFDRILSPQQSGSPPLQMLPLNAPQATPPGRTTPDASRQHWHRRVADAGTSAIDRLSNTVSSLLDRPGWVTCVLRQPCASMPTDSKASYTRPVVVDVLVAAAGTRVIDQLSDTVPSLPDRTG